MVNKTFASTALQAVAHEITDRKLSIKKEVATLKTYKKLLTSLLNQISFVESRTNYVCVSPNSSSVNVYITLRGLNGFKDELLEKLITVVTDFGDSNFNHVKCTTDECAQVMNRNYNYGFYSTPERSSWNYDIAVQISAYVSSDSPTCKKIKVGEEIKVVDKFEIVCD